MGGARWDPWNDIISLREAMSNLLEESFVRPRPGAASAAGLALDVRETGAGYEVTASVPGVAPDDVEITVLGDTLRIRGERRDPHETGAGADGTQPQDQNQGRWLVRERRFGAFERTVSLPTAVRADAAHADFKDGVLTVTLPKADEAKPRAIPVRGAAPAAPQEIEVAGSEAADVSDAEATTGPIPSPS